MNFFKTVLDDLKNKPWPPGTTTAEKNKYREILAGLLLAAAIGLFFSPIPWVGIVPLGVAIWKFKIILTDK